MAQSPPAYVTPAVLRWAREVLGYSIEAAARKVNVTPDRLRGAEAGEMQLTMRQAEAAAKAYERSLAELFVPKPPAEDPVEAQLRQLPDAPPLPWPVEMRALSRRIRERQAAALELYELIEEEPPWRSVNIEYVDDSELLAQRARAALHVSLEEQRAWRDRDRYRPLREWLDAVEALGVLVMQDGSVQLETMRGFASPNELVPAIVVNTDDDPRARAFTVVHELGHLLRPQFGGGQDPIEETWCNDFAGAVLMPSEELQRDFAPSRGGDLLHEIDRLALSYGTTPHATAVRISRLHLISDAQARQLIAQITERSQRFGDAQVSGGNYYRTMVTRLGPRYVQLVFTALDTQAVSFPVASGLLGVKVNHFHKLRETTLSRGLV